MIESAPRSKMSDTYTLELRSTFGKKVSRLRREGLLPANLYGRGIESAAVQLRYTDGRDLLNSYGKNNLFQVQISGESEARPVIVRDVSVHPVSRKILHIDFFQVDLTRTVQADVPLLLTGTAPGVSMYGGVIVQASDRLLIEALPADLPESLEVDISGLEELGSQLFVSEVKVPSGVTVLTDSEALVAAVQQPRVNIEREDELAEGEEDSADEETQTDSGEEESED